MSTVSLFYRFIALVSNCKLVLIGIMLCSHSIIGAGADAADIKKFNIQMVVWRGVTIAEQTFMRTVIELGLTDKVRVWDAAQSPAHLKTIRKEILAQPPDLLYLFGTTVTLAFAGPVANPNASNALQRVPMIFNIVADPVGSGITKDYGPTGRNLTGVSHSVPLPVQAKIISDLGIHKVTALFNPDENNSAVTLKTLNKHLLSNDIGLTLFPITKVPTKKRAEPKYWQKVAKKLKNTDVELIYLPSDSLIISHANDIVTAMHQAHLPTFSATEDPISKAGALMGVISHYAAAGHHAGTVAERILREGVPASTIPIATPTHYLFLVNELSMRQLEYYPPIPLLQFAEFTNGTANSILPQPTNNESLHQ